MDKYTWSLDELYTSFDSDEFKSDRRKLEKSILEINKWTGENLLSFENQKEKLEYYINFQNELGDLAGKLFEYTQLYLSTNASDTNALKISEQLEEELSELTETNVGFQKWLCEIKDFDSLLEKSDIIKAHEYILKEIIEQGKYTLSNEEEIIISKMKNTGSSSWTKLQELVTSTMDIPITINGEEKIIPLPELRNLAHECDKNIRKTAYECEIDALEKIATTSAFCLNGIKGEVLTVSKLRKYKSPLEMTLLNSRIDKKTLDVMLEAMYEILPEYEKYFFKKAEILGHKNGLPFFDLFAPIGSVDMKFSYEEACEFIVENFASFSKKLSDYAKNAIKKRWIDVYPKKGKRGGAFCSNLHSIKESRILTNFTGSFNDVITIAHELGHGYHGSLLDKETYLNSDYPMPIAETASTFCETIVKKAALKTLDDEKQKIVLESEISDSAQIVVDILSRYIFEDEVFKLRKNGSLSADELCEIMLNAQSKTYGKGLDKNYMHKYMWICKPHYYDADYNYYNFPYAFGLLFAKGLYSMFEKNGSKFVEKYDALLSSTGKNSLFDVAKLVDVDICEKSFWKSSTEILKKDIEFFCS